jgi:hypothetical protein
MEADERGAGARDIMPDMRWLLSHRKYEDGCSIP